MLHSLALAKPTESKAMATHLSRGDITESSLWHEIAGDYFKIIFKIKNR